MPSVLHLSDLSADEEDVVCCRMNEYEKKIDSLINAVGMMKEVRRWRRLGSSFGAIEDYPGHW